ncbi:hypothetical protein QFZ27_003562 [Inquilinus ginsengisoli]|uniref:glycosyl hydrolase family 28-related protein n=1 Tax=Inquilinus ginsengisoli TaxID=363840 RepID=UPI003D24135B
MPTDRGIFTNIDDMRQYSIGSTTDFDSVYVEGYYAAGDGGGGHFFWKGDAAISFAGNITSGSNLIQNATNVSQLRVWMEVSGQGVPGFPAKTRITAISGTTVTLSLSATETATGRTFAVADDGISFRPNALALPDSKGRWLRIVEDDEPYSVKWFGAKGDGLADDGPAIMATINASLPSGKFVRLPKGSYGVTAPIYLNGNAWVNNGKPMAGEQPFVRAFFGDVFANFSARIFALPGFTGEAVLFGRNAAFRAVKNLHVDAANIADVAIDISWIGTASGSGGVAPSCINEFTGWLAENAIVKGIVVDGAADSLVQNLNYRGGTPQIGFSLRLPGGGIWANNIHIHRGRTEIEAQNARISDSVLLNGVQIVGQALDLLEFTSCQFSTDPTNGWTIYSNPTANPEIGPTISPFAINFTSCFFLGGATHTYYFAGSWSTGAKFTACHFGKREYFDTVTTTVPGKWVPLGGSTRPPVFDFDHCTFEGGDGVPSGEPIAFPVSVPGKVLVGTYACRRGDGIVISRRDFPGDVRLTGGFFEDTTADGIAAAGTTLATATPLTAGLNNITSTTAGSAEGVVLPTPAPGRRVSVWNNSTNNLKVYPVAGTSLNGSAVPLTLAPGQNRNFRAIIATRWLLD